MTSNLKKGRLRVLVLIGILLIALAGSVYTALLLGLLKGTMLEPISRVSSEGLIPLTDMRSSTYLGYPGGLYSGAGNAMPMAHLDDGLALAKKVQPRDGNGLLSPSGKVVLLSIGMSNTLMEFNEFIKAAAKDGSLNPALLLVNGAQGGMTAKAIQNPSDNSTGMQYWSYVDGKLTAAGVTREQVQVVWLLEADSGPSGSAIAYAQTLSQELVKIAQVLRQRFPNLLLLYISSRIYGGYATSGLNPEPFAYASGLAVKWTIEKQLNGSAALNYDEEKGALKAPWMAWGPYMWTNGALPRDDGLTWSAADFGSDGTHPSPQGCSKVARMLMDFLKSEATTKTWFLRQ